MFVGGTKPQAVNAQKHLEHSREVKYPHNIYLKFVLSFIFSVA